MTDALLVLALAVAIDQVAGNIFHPVVIGRSGQVAPRRRARRSDRRRHPVRIAGLLFAVPLTAMVTAAAGELQR
ncbi:MAG: hypothetical protein KY450_13095 [Actinobacteria bacterium]|nr:hypothetical protein [Actinomycetota bacterium]